MGFCSESESGRVYTETRRESFWLCADEVQAHDGDHGAEFDYKDLPEMIAMLNEVLNSRQYALWQKGQS